MLIGITIVSTLAAITATVVALRVVREERRRSETRVAALAHEIHATTRFDLDLQPAARTASVSARATPVNASFEQAINTNEMFSSATPRSGRPRLGLSLAIAGFLAATVGAVAIVLDGMPQAASSASAPPEVGRANDATTRTSDANAPLELVSLAHERDGDTLTVRGSIRNPVSGLEMDRLTAVVSVFDRDGGFVASGRAPVESQALIPGGESTFAVAIPGAGTIARYRVSFRSGDRSVAHVDKRTIS
jgi:hypothetical protein